MIAPPRRTVLADLFSNDSPAPCKSWEPTEDEIREACLRIQSTWDVAERERRSQYQQEPVTVVRWNVGG